MHNKLSTLRLYAYTYGEYTVAIKAASGGWTVVFYPKAAESTHSLNGALTVFFCVSIIFFCASSGCICDRHKVSGHRPTLAGVPRTPSVPATYFCDFSRNCHIATSLLRSSLVRPSSVNLTCHTLPCPVLFRTSNGPYTEPDQSPSSMPYVLFYKRRQGSLRWAGMGRNPAS